MSGCGVSDPQVPHQAGLVLPSVLWKHKSNLEFVGLEGKVRLMLIIVFYDYLCVFDTGWTLNEAARAPSAVFECVIIAHRRKLSDISLLLITVKPVEEADDQPKYFFFKSEQTLCYCCYSTLKLPKCF